MEDETLFIAIDANDADALVGAVRAAVPAAVVAVQQEETPPPAREFRLGRDPVLRSQLAQIAVVAVTGAGFSGAVAKVLVEHIRAKRRTVRIITADGTSVELNNYNASEAETIVDKALTPQLPPAEQA